MPVPASQRPLHTEAEGYTIPTYSDWEQQLFRDTCPVSAASCTSYTSEDIAAADREDSEAAVLSCWRCYTGTGTADEESYEGKDVFLQT